MHSVYSQLRPIVKTGIQIRDLTRGHEVVGSIHTKPKCMCVYVCLQMLMPKMVVFYIVYNLL